MLFVAVFALLAGPACARSAAVGAEELYAIPKGMLIGAGTSAIQTEGAWDQDGKGVSHADYLLHLGKLGALFFGDPHAHDTAADSYHRYKEDVAMAAALKLKLYRFSFSWSRLLPTGDASKPNPKGVEFYNNLINEILSHDMVPMATLYHFDHPQNFEEEFKGWQGEQMVDKFEEYSRFVFKEFSDRVKLWNTINEANMYCTYFPSLFVESELYTKEEADVYQCLRHTILGHAKAYRAFKEGGYDGKVGFSALLMHARPNSTLPEDILAADTFNEMHAGTSLHPVVFGDYPEVVKELLGARLKPFTEQEKQLVKGTSDFFGYNVYYGMRATWQDPDTPPDEFAKIPVLGQFVDDIPYLRLSVNGVDATNIIQMFSLIEPDAIRSAVIWAWETYKVPMVISENGYGDSFGLGIHDERRAVYHSAFLRTLVSTIKTFKIDVMGYAAWSLIDSFEWSGAYSRPFGLVHVDYEGGTLKRTLKDSASFWVELGNTGVVPLVEMSSTTPQSTSAPKQTTAIPVSSSTTKQGGGPSGAGSAAASSMLLLLMSLFALLGE